MVQNLPFGNGPQSRLESFIFITGSTGRLLRMLRIIIIPKEVSRIVNNDHIIKLAVRTFSPQFTVVQLLLQFFYLMCLFLLFCRPISHYHHHFVALSSSFQYIYTIPIDIDGCQTFCCYSSEQFSIRCQFLDRYLFNF